MTKFTLPSLSTLATMLALSLYAAPAQAADRTWGASNGGGTDCFRATPCASFQAAHDASNPGGEINCVDAGNYGAVTITQAISILCDDTQAHIGTSTGSHGILIQAGANDIVTLKGLD